MNAFWLSLAPIDKFFTFCALLGGIMFVVRTVLMFLGGDGGNVDGDVDTIDVHHGDADVSFKLLSFQGVTAFFMMFGLVGLALSRQTRLNEAAAVAGGVAAGGLTVWIIGKIFLGMKRLQDDGTLNLQNAVGQEGTVYLTIAPGGAGKAQIVIQGRLQIFDAVTEGPDALKTGERIRVTKLSGANILVVEKA